MSHQDNNTTIPKVIHYCWLSDDPYPAKIKRCIDSWLKQLPDYEIKLWNTHNFDIESVPYVFEAYKAKKWAFAADYIRMYALYHEGGIYLDSDVEVVKNFDPFLCHNFFSSLEYHPSQIERTGAEKLIDKDGHRIADEYVSGIQIQAAVMGAKPHCSFVKDVLDWYAENNFVFNHDKPGDTLLSPQIYARVAEKYGFIYKDVDQELSDGIKIYRSEIFAGNKHEVTPASFAIHNCAHSWHASPKEKLAKWLSRFLVGIVRTARTSVSTDT